MNQPFTIGGVISELNCSYEEARFHLWILDNILRSFGSSLKEIRKLEDKIQKDNQLLYNSKRRNIMSLKDLPPS